MLTIPGLAWSESSTLLEDRLDNAPSAATERRFGIGDGSVIVAPVPFSSPMIGSGLGLGAGYIYKNQGDTRSSNFGIGGFYSDNGSFGYGLAANIATRGNRWLLKLFVGAADVKYDLYTGLGTIPVEQTGTLGRLSLNRGITPNLSFGVMLRYLDTTISPEFGLLPPALRPEANLELLNYGLSADWDLRDNDTYPTKGARLQVEAFHGQSLGDIDLDYDKAFLTYDSYFSLGQTSVLTARFFMCGASQSAPFFDSCGLGLDDKFRGFNVTRYIGDRSASAQVEFRQRLGKRLGFVVFGGIGSAGTAFDTLNSAGWHSAGGIGARYRVSKKFPVDFSVDVAWNSDDDTLLYISVGQRW